MRRLKAELDAGGMRTPLRHHRNGRRTGGGLFARGKLYALLANPLYAGCIRHKGAVHPGQHEAIVAETIWQAVQDQLAANRQVTARRSDAKAPSPLAGKLADPDGCRMRPSHATKNGRRYRYYVSADLIEGNVATGARGWRIPAPEIEAALAHVVASRLRAPSFASSLIADGHVGAEDADAAIARIAEIIAVLDAPQSRHAVVLLRTIVRKVDLGETELCATIDFDGLDREPKAGYPDATLANTILAGVPGFTVSAPIRLVRRGAELRLVLQGAGAPTPKPDAQLIRALIEARCRVADFIESCGRLNVSDLAKRDNLHASDVSRSLQLAFLAPDIVEGILNGSLSGLTSETLKRIGELPLAWDEQRALLS